MGMMLFYGKEALKFCRLTFMAQGRWGTYERLREK